MEEREQTKIINRLANAVEAVYVRPRKLYVRSFFSGVFSALGATVGLALVAALIGLLAREFGGLPVIGQWLINIGHLLPAKK